MITSLTLTDFRNHAASRIKTDGARNIVITGPNGSGKTSILEAISIMSPGTGLRGASPQDMIRLAMAGGPVPRSPRGPQAIEDCMGWAKGEGGFGVVAELEDNTEISVAFNISDTYRKIRIDGDSTALSDLSRHLRLVWITPREDRLFADAAADRRAFFDRLVSGFDAAHSGRTARLAKLLSERAFAIKNNANDKWLTPIESQIAATAVSVAAARVLYAGEINYFLSNGAAIYAVSMSGMLEEKLAAGQSAAEAEREYAAYLSQNRELVADKMTILGPHRTDFGMFNERVGMPVAFTSTGQQKAAILALVCAHAKLVRARTGASPVILLDEVAAHLDADARAAFFGELGFADAQIWITGLERSAFEDLEDAKFIGCESGRVCD